MKVENEFRAEKCPKYGKAFCPIPFEKDGGCEPPCPEEWDCKDLKDKT